MSENDIYPTPFQQVYPSQPGQPGQPYQPPTGPTTGPAPQATYGQPGYGQTFHPQGSGQATYAAGTQPGGFGDPEPPTLKQLAIQVAEVAGLLETLKRRFDTYVDEHDTGAFSSLTGTAAINHPDEPGNPYRHRHGEPSAPEHLTPAQQDSARLLAQVEAAQGKQKNAQGQPAYGVPGYGQPAFTSTAAKAQPGTWPQTPAEAEEARQKNLRYPTGPVG